MLYAKCILAGLTALLGALLVAVIGFIGWGWWFAYKATNQGVVGTVAYDISSPWFGLPLLITAALIFLAGFSWEFRRARRHSR